MIDNFGLNGSIDLLGQLTLSNPLVIAAGVAAVLLLGMLVLRRRPSAPQGRGNLDLAAVDASPPPADGPKLLCNGIPVRLVAIVLAPLGPQGEAPQGAGALNRIVPGLGEVAAAHGARVMSWEPQVSLQNFMLAFFGFIHLPGNGGVGTPWCAAAGKVQGIGSMFVAGVVMRAELPNNLEQFRLERPSRWLDVLQISKT